MGQELQTLLLSEEPEVFTGLFTWALACKTQHLVCRSKWWFLLEFWSQWPPMCCFVNLGPEITDFAAVRRAGTLLLLAWHGPSVAKPGNWFSEVSGEPHSNLEPVTLHSTGLFPWCQNRETVRRTSIKIILACLHGARNVRLCYCLKKLSVWLVCLNWASAAKPRKWFAEACGESYSTLERWISLYGLISTGFIVRARS